MKSGENVRFFIGNIHRLLVLIDIEFNKGSSFDSIAAQRTGLCPDMCCERERLTREYQRLYKSYELDSDTRAVRIIIPLFLLFNSEDYFCS